MNSVVYFQESSRHPLHEAGAGQVADEAVRAGQQVPEALPGSSQLLECSSTVLLYYVTTCYTSSHIVLYHRLFTQVKRREIVKKIEKLLSPEMYFNYVLTVL